MTNDDRFKRYAKDREALEALGSMNQSALSALKIILIRQRFPPQHNTFFDSGTAVHEIVLEEKTKLSVTLSIEDDRDVTGMVHSLKRCLPLDGLLYRAKREEFVTGKVLGHWMHGTLDILNRYMKVIGDIKTTSTKSLTEFERAARKYGYFRQAFVYCTLTGIKRFVFVCVQKHPPYNVFLLDTSDYPADMAYAAEEVKFLLELNKLMKHGKV